MKKEMLIILLLLAALLFPQMANSAVSVVDTYTAASLDSTTHTESVTLSGSADYLVACIAAEYNLDIQTVTWNSVSMTEAGTDCTGNYPCASIFYLAAPDTGTHNIVATFNQTVRGSRIGVVSLAGAANQAPDVVIDDSDFTHTITTLVDGSFVMDCAATPFENSTFVNGGVQTTLFIDTDMGDSGDGGSAASGYYLDAVAGTVAMDWSYSTAATGPHVSVSIAPAATGGAARRIW